MCSLWGGGVGMGGERVAEVVCHGQGGLLHNPYSKWILGRLSLQHVAHIVCGLWPQAVTNLDSPSVRGQWFLQSMHCVAAVS